MTIAEEYEIIWQFVERVNKKAEYKIVHTGKFEGAHYTAMQEELGIIRRRAEAETGET